MLWDQDAKLQAGQGAWQTDRITSEQVSGLFEAPVKFWDSFCFQTDTRCNAWTQRQIFLKSEHLAQVLVWPGSETGLRDCGESRGVRFKPSTCRAGPISWPLAEGAIRRGCRFSYKRFSQPTRLPPLLPSLTLIYLRCFISTSDLQPCSCPLCVFAQQGCLQDPS